MALYLKYRPQDFTSMVWQDFVKNTLQTAVETNKTVWAYLLCWPRGTGKTTTARILAKAVNCKNSNKWNPCNTCKACEWINAESLVDVVEIDAASHTWVDNIRELIEKAQFQPTNATYKIYIIDEVHMLSKWAFNALLKILEEPPSYVKFILATTETHKVPETILSRCQRYDLKNISIEDIKSRLSFIAKEENITIDEKSLEYIAKNATWAMRNAISLFEQLSSNGDITFDRIIDELWIVNTDILCNFLSKLLARDGTIIEDFNAIILDGKNPKLFIKELLFYTKDTLISDVSKGNQIQDSIHILDTLDNAYTLCKNSLDEATTITIALLKIIHSYAPPTHSVDTQRVTTSSENTNWQNKEAIPSTSSPSNTTVPVGISQDDAIDIFSDDASTFTKTKTVTSPPASNSSSFDKELYISTLKSSWAKWAVTMSIRAADLQLDGSILKIHFKTKFSLNSVNNTDTISLLNQALTWMSLDWYSVQLVS